MQWHTGVRRECEILPPAGSPLRARGDDGLGRDVYAPIDNTVPGDVRPANEPPHIELSITHRPTKHVWDLIHMLYYGIAFIAACG